MRRIARAVARRLGVPCRVLYGRDRSRLFAHGRQLAMLLCYDLTGASITDIARCFQRDRATVFHGIRSTRIRLASGDPRYRALRLARIAVDEEYCMQPDIPLEQLQSALATFRGVYRHRHTRMTKLLQAGAMTQAQVALESKQLTAILRRAEAWATGQEPPVPIASLTFAPEDLAARLERLADACTREGDISLPGAEHVAEDLRTLAACMVAPADAAPSDDV